MTRDEQFAYIETARASILQWARERGIPLHRIEFVAPFVDTNFGLSSWFFYETDEQLRCAGDMGWPDHLDTHFIEALRVLGYAPEWLSNVRFFYDSHENVVNHYEGSYFYRLR